MASIRARGRSPWRRAASPLFYLHRRLRPASGGCGARRGGNSAEIALTLRGVPGATALVMTHGAEVPNSAGLFGGWPGSTVRQRFRTGSAPSGPDEGDGWRDLGPKPGDLPMSAGDVFSVSWQGGGGFGDPLERSPDSVLTDILAGLLTAPDARRIYGIILDGDALDPDLTVRERRQMRAARLGRPVTDPPAESAVGRPLGPGLVAVDGPDGVEVRTHAGAVLSRGHTRWRAGAVAARLDPGDHGITLHEDLAMTAYYCPLSGVQLAVDVHRRDEAAYRFGAAAADRFGGLDVLVNNAGTTSKTGPDDLEG